MQHSAVLGRAKNCIASNCTLSFVNMSIFKSYLDLHLSESDWCRFVVRFGLSDLTDKCWFEMFPQITQPKLDYEPGPV